MNHASDVAHQVRDLLAADPSVHRAVLVQGEPAARTDYPNRDGEWLVYVAMRDLRYFRLQVTCDETVREQAVELEGVPPKEAR